MTRSFPSLTEAIAHWTGRDPTPLRSAVAPPCDGLGDEVYDCFLARIFASVAAADSVIERVAYLDARIAINGPQLIELDATPGHGEAFARLKAAIDVLDRWRGALLDVDAQNNIEGRNAA